MAAISGSHSGSQKTRQIAAALFSLMHFDEIHLVKVRGSNEKWKLVTEAGIGRTGNFDTMADSIQKPSKTYALLLSIGPFGVNFIKSETIIQN